VGETTHWSGSLTPPKHPKPWLAVRRCMARGLSAFGNDSGPWALLIIIGGIILVGALLWTPFDAAISALGADVPDAAPAVVIGLLVILGGVALYMWRHS
jgi:uncharacterized protein (DUF983 family)